jgi:DNA polymerase III sliding clamp (beta) subunit (PCNA family)
MIINKAKLQEALETVKPGLADKSVIEQATSFAFTNGRVVTYNDEISISHPVEGLELEGAIKADKLYPFLTKIKKEEIDMVIKGSEIIITSGRIKAGLPMESEITLPLDKEIAEKKKWKPLPENFVKFVDFCKEACGTDMSKPILTCVHINQKGFIEASDNLRMCRCTLAEDMPVKTFLIPSSSAVQVVRLNPTKISEGNGWVHFKTDIGTVLSCRVWDDKYKDLSQNLLLKGVRLLLPKTIDEILDRASIFTKMDHVLDESVVVSLGDNRFKMRAETDAGWFEEQVNIKYDKEPIFFTVTPYLLKNILKETSLCEFTGNKLKFEGAGWVYLAILRHQE